MPSDRDLVRLYWPVGLRPAFDALFAIDDALAEVVRTTTEPALGAIRLAWWREALERLDHAPPPAEPRLQNAAAQLLTKRVSGTALSTLEEGWLSLLQEPPWSAEAIAAVAERGRRLFALGATLIGADDATLGEAGAVFALADPARRFSDRDSAALTDAARAIPMRFFAKALRPLTALTALARRDLAIFPRLEPEATPARAFVLLRHRMMGRA